MGKVELKVEIDDSLLEQIEASGMNVSLIAERALLQALEKLRPEDGRALAVKWRAENAEAIVAHNRGVRERGYPQAQILRW